MTKSVDISGSHNLESATGMLSIEARNAAEQPIVYRTNPLEQIVFQPNMPTVLKLGNLVIRQFYWPSGIHHEAIE